MNNDRTSFCLESEMRNRIYIAITVVVFLVVAVIISKTVNRGITENEISQILKSDSIDFTGSFDTVLLYSTDTETILFFLSQEEISGSIFLKGKSDKMEYSAETIIINGDLNRILFFSKSDDIYKLTSIEETSIEVRKSEIRFVEDGIAYAEPSKETDRVDKIFEGDNSGKSFSFKNNGLFIVDDYVFRDYIILD